MFGRGRRTQTVVLLVALAGASHADAQGPTEPEDHFHYLHFEFDKVEATEQYPDGPETEALESEMPDEEGEADAEEVVEDEVEAEEEVEEDTVATFDLSGWLWFNYAIQPWRDTTLARYGNFEFNQLQLNGLATFGNFSMRFEIRYFTFMFILRQGWIQYAWKDNAIQVGHLNVPWGRQLFSSDSWWFTLGWYATIGDDYDYGVRYVKETERYRVDVGYYFRDQIGFGGDANRWDSDLTPLGEQQNREVSSIAARGYYKFGHRDGMRSDFGAVVQAGLLPNVATNELGYRWLAQVLYNGTYKGWKPLLQATRHEFRPQNPAEIDGVPVDSRVVRISQFGGYRDVAAKYWLLNASIAKEIPFSRKYFNALVPYVEYSGFFKDEEAFPDSHLITVGMQVHLGPVWLWLDFLTGKNATYLNDSLANSALAGGANRSERFEHQTNLQIQYYF